nr:PepSY-associated TM helix domain-containing protein [Aliiroseovarius sp.]
MKSFLRKLHIPVTARDWHSLVGMVFLLVLLFLFVTGTLSVFGREIDWLFTPEQRVAVQAEGKQSFGAIYDAVSASHPGARSLSILRLPGARFADQVTIQDTTRGKLIVYVDPYRALVQGDAPFNNLWRTLRELHRGLSSERRPVQILITFMTIPLAAMLITSLMLYPKFYRGFFRLPKRGARLRAQLSDLHRFIGAWSMVFIIVVVLTSAEFMIESVGLGPNYYPFYAEPAKDTEPPLPEGFSGADLDRSVALAVEKYPGLMVSDIVLPSRNGEALAIRGDLTAKLVRPSANSVIFDPATLELRGAYRAETSGIHLWFFEAMRVIHYGSFAGLTSRLLWLVLGLGLSVLAAAGALIYAERLIFMSKRGDKYQRRTRFGHIWFGMGPGKWIGLASLVAAMWWTIQ